MVTMPMDPELTDQALGSEIELLADVMDVASCSDSVLTQDQLDSALGVLPPEREDEEPGPA